MKILQNIQNVYHVIKHCCFAIVTVLTVEKERNVSES